MTTPANDAATPQCPIAIVGMGCLFPNARNVKEFWHTLRTGRDGITDVPNTHWKASDFLDVDPKRPDMTYCARGGFLPATPFDPIEFGIPPTALEATDTAQLLGLVVARQAMEDAGYGEAGRAFEREKCSVILGVTGTLELALPLAARLGHPIWRKALADAGITGERAERIVAKIADGYVPWQENSFPGLLGNVVAGRIANRLNLRGTNCVVDAACASSLSAVHLASMELTTGKADMVLTGGVDTLNDIFMFMCFSKTPALSPTGDARPFSDDGDGTVIGEGIGMVVLKRLSDAERDGDRIYAVIRGIGSSSDGRSQSIYAPYAAGQARALRNAYKLAGVNPTSVDMIEAHGTGTKVGDAVEFDALQTVYREAEANGSWCGIGSVKSQIGHTKAAAGAAGLIKAALALSNRVLPPSLKVKRPNPKLNIDASPFYVNADARPWMARPGAPRRAGVSSFGFGGSNFHVVLEEAPQASRRPAWDGSVQILSASGETPAELDRQLAQWHAELGSEAVGSTRLAHTAFESRKSFRAGAKHRLLLVIESSTDVAKLVAQTREKIASGDAQAWTTANAFYGFGANAGGVALLFPGQGSQYVGMGRDLACTFPEIRDALANAEANGATGLAEFVFPRSAFDDEARSRQDAALTQTDVAQPALGAISAGMLGVLGRFGVTGDAFAGHSFGELTALHAAGRINEAALHRLAIARGRIMADSADGSGSMLAVQGPIEVVEQMIADAGLDVVLANRNAPTQAVLSGPRESLAKAAELLKGRGLRTRALNVGGAFHSPMMAAAREPFRGALDAVVFTASLAPVMSCVAGNAYPDVSAAMCELLADQLVRPVRFIEMVQRLYESGIRTFVEVGPKSVLTGLVQSILGDKERAAFAVDASAGRRCGIADFARVIARLAAEGRDVDLTQWETPAAAPRVQRMSIPLVGANYRSPRALVAGDDMKFDQSLDPGAAGVGRGAPNEVRHERAGVNVKRSSSEFEPVVPTNVETPPIEIEEYVDVSNHDRIESQVSQDVLALMQEGLRAMQTLQQQTAAAHEQFLRGQEMAHQTFARLVDAQMQAISGAPVSTESGQSASAPPMRPPPTLMPTISPPVAQTTSTARAAASLAVPAPINARQSAPAMAAAKSATSPASVVTPIAALPASPASPVVTPAPASPDLEKLVLAVVGEKTGYPVEMIELDMDIEADLGIDSIKRVEIVAAIEERMPGAQSIAPERMGALRTLRQILTLMGGEAGAAVSTAVAIESPRSHVTEPAPAAITDKSSARVKAAVDVSDTLLDVVSRLTGYPREMLDLDMDIEADLGIDSIKRVEILAAVEASAPAFAGISPERLGSMRTLRQIAQSGLAGNAPTTNESAPSSPVNSQTAVASEPEVRPPAPSRIDRPLRREVALIDLPPIGDGPLALAPDRDIWITDDGTRLPAALAAALDARGVSARIVKLEEFGVLRRASDARKDSPMTVGPVAGIIVLAPPVTARSETGREESDVFLKHALGLVQRVAGDLRSASQSGGAVLMTVSRMDGGFGLRGGEFDAVQGGLAGLAKTAAREWPEVRCRALDVSPAWHEDASIAAAIVRELSVEAPIEVGLDANRRRGLEMAAGREVDPNSLQARIKPGDVLVLTGGARGVTAAAAEALARQFQPTLVLLGRTELRESTPPWLSGVTGEAALKNAIVANVAATGGRMTPAELQTAYRRIESEIEIRNTIARLEAAGSRAIYKSVDVRDAAAVVSTFADIRSSVGPIRGIVHAAGVLEDRRIEDKTAEQFGAVYSTKVVGLRNLLAACDGDDLRCLVLFSSASARMGNAGQVDYAMANEVLNKIAQRAAVARPDCRVISMNWGPWAGGMVTPALARLFTERGVELISLEGGSAALVDELSRNDAAVEIVIGSAFESLKEQAVESGGDADSNAVDVSISSDRTAPAPAGIRTNSSSAFTVAMSRVLDDSRHAFMRSHVIGGRPVLPMAMMVEWFAHAALHGNPGLHFSGLDEVRVLKGLALDNGHRPIQLMAARARREGDGYLVDCELRSQASPTQEITHARAAVRLIERTSDAAQVMPAVNGGSAGQTVPTDALYRDVLFHGPMLRAIDRIDRLGDDGLRARVRCSPRPSEWMIDPPRSGWLTDPLAIDAVMQLAIVWSENRIGAPCLPNFIERYRQFAAFPAGHAVVTLAVRSHGSRRLAFDAWIGHEDGRACAVLEGCECTVDASLRGAFRRGGRAVGDVSGLIS